MKSCRNTTDGCIPPHNLAFAKGEIESDNIEDQLKGHFKYPQFLEFLILFCIRLCC